MARIRGLLVILLLAASVVLIVFKAEVSTDLRLFLPEPTNHVETLLHHQLDNGVSTRMLFVGLSGLPSNELARASEALVDSLSGSPLFSRVVNRADELGDEVLQFIVRNRYQLSRRDLAAAFSAEGFEEALSDRLAGLTGPEAALEKRFLRRDPTGEVLALLTEWQGKLSSHKRPAERHGVWFSGDFERALVLAEIRPGAMTLEVQARAIASLRSEFDRIVQPGLHMTLTGPAAFAVETGEDIRQDVRVLTWLAVTFVTLFLLLVYRSIAMVLLVFLPLLMGVIAATAGILLIHGHIHGITLAFGITLAGVAVDYPIHMMAGRDRHHGSNPVYAASIWPTLRLGVLSTVVAYTAFLLSGFSGLVQLGQFTITGLLVAALFARWVLPMLLSGRFESRPGLQGLHGRLLGMLPVAGKLRWLVVVMLAGGLLTLAGTERPVLHLDVDTLSPIKESRRAEGKMLRDDLGFWHGGRLLVISAADKESVLKRSEALEPDLEMLRKAGLISGFDMASQFLPSVESQLRNLEAIRDVPAIQQRFQETLIGSPFRPDTFAPFYRDMDAIAEAQPISAETLVSEGIGRRLEPLLFDIDGQSAGVVLLHGVTDESALQRFADERDGVIYMHLKTAATELVTRSVERVRLIMLGCLFVIYLLLWQAFRSALRPLRILVPTISAAAATAALLVCSGNPLSTFHLISMMLVIGLGLDYALFFNRLSGDDAEWDTTFRSLWICGITTILVFGFLVFSSTPPLRAIGMTVGIGAALSMLFAALWTPHRSLPERSTQRGS